MAVCCFEPVPRFTPLDLNPGHCGGEWQERRVPKVVAGKSLGNGGHCLPFPPPPGSGPTLPVVASRELTNPVISLVPASPWRPRVTPHHRSAAVLPQPRLGNRPRSPRGSEEVWGRGV